MDRPTVCPLCLSKFEDIRGMVYAAGTAQGERCENEWHRGANYHPEILELTEADREFLSAQKIGF